MLLSGALILAAYLCGSVTFAVGISRILHRPDPREGGSMNPGATNMLRLYGWLAGALTLAGDALKGLLAVLAARWLDQPEAVAGGCALAVFLGHLYPVFYGFTGGKGVATLGGASFGLHWLLGLIYLVAWLMAAAVSRYAAVAAVAAAGACIAAACLLAETRVFLLVLLPIGALVAWRHRSNFRRLLDGTEDRIGTG